jgi:hypothetical protein
MIIPAAPSGSKYFGNCFDYSPRKTRGFHERMPDEGLIGLFCWADLSAKTSLDWQEEGNGVIETFHKNMSLRIFEKQ